MPCSRQAPTSCTSMSWTITTCPNLTIGPLVCEALRKHGVKAPIDVHLMVSPVDRIVPDFAAAGATYISFHPEATAAHRSHHRADPRARLQARAGVQSRDPA